MAIENIIGDCAAFFAGLIRELNGIGIDVDRFSVSHLCYRVSTLAEYENKREELKGFCRAFMENEFNERPVSMLLLRSPLALSDAHHVSLIELPAPRAAHTY